MKKNIIISAMAGNILEQYDIVIFGFMAPYIAKAFFPPGDTGINSIIHVLYIFVLGYAVRPVGGLILGFLSDYWGRKKTLILSIMLMGISTSVIGILPSYEAIGSAATLLLLLCRFSQGFAVGGEYITSITFLVEHASQKNRGFMGSWGAFGVNLGNLIASLLSTVVIYFISQSYLPTWSWRFVFIITIIGVWIGWLVRIKSSETLPFIRENSMENKLFLKQHCSNIFNTAYANKKNCFLIIALTSLGTSATYLIYLYAPLHAIMFHNMSMWKALVINSTSIMFLVALIPFFGYLSDRYGKKIFLLISSGMLFILAYPFFWIISYGTLITFLIIQIGVSVAIAIFHSLAPTLIVEIIPVRTRCATGGFLYGIAASVFGVSSPIICFYLVKYTKSYVSPAYYLLMFSLFAFVAIYFFLKEEKLNTQHNESLNFSNIEESI